MPSSEYDVSKEANSKRPAERPLGFQGKYCQFKWKLYDSSSFLPSHVPSKTVSGTVSRSSVQPRDDYLGLLALLYID